VLVPVLFLCTWAQASESPVRRIALSVLSDAAKHSEDLAKVVVESAALPAIVGMLSSRDTRVQRQVCSLPSPFRHPLAPWSVFCSVSAPAMWCSRKLQCYSATVLQCYSATVLQ